MAALFDVPIELSTRLEAAPKVDGAESATGVLTGTGVSDDDLREVLRQFA